MTTIVTRAGKGASLTWTEMDANFTNLKTAVDDHIAGDWVSVKTYGATGDGVTDDTAAMQLAHDTGGLIYYPSGTYKFTTITLASGGIIGDGQTETILESTNTGTENLITCTGASVGGPANGLTFRDFQVLGTLSGPNPAKASGAGIAIAPAANENSYACFDNVTVAYVPTGINLVRASYVNIVGCRFLAYNLEGVKVANANDNDSGDSTIFGCTFSCPYAATTSAGVRHLSSGGLRINNNKFLGGGYGYKMDFTDSAGSGASTGVLHIVSNSIENFTSAAIYFSRVSAGLSVFANVVIASNEIDVSLASTPASLIASDAAAWLRTMTICGNSFSLPNVANSYGINLYGVTALNISGNTFRASGGTSQGIKLDTCTDVKVGPNTYAGVTTEYSTASATRNNNIADAMAESTWVPVVTATTGTITAYTATGKYSKVGNRYVCDIDITITTKGTAANSMIVTLPATPSGAGGGSAVEIVNTGKSIQGYTVGTNSIWLLEGGLTPFVANGDRFVGSFTFTV